MVTIVLVSQALFLTVFCWYWTFLSAVASSANACIAGSGKSLTLQVIDNKSELPGSKRACKIKVALDSPSLRLVVFDVTSARRTPAAGIHL